MYIYIYIYICMCVSLSHIYIYIYIYIYIKDASGACSQVQLPAARAWQRPARRRLRGLLLRGKDQVRLMLGFYYNFTNYNFRKPLITFLITNILPEGCNSSFVWNSRAESEDSGSAGRSGMTWQFLYMCICVYVYIHNGKTNIYIYICIIEREGERERERETHTHTTLRTPAPRERPSIHRVVWQSFQLPTFQHMTKHQRFVSCTDSSYLCLFQVNIWHVICWNDC